MQGQAWGREVEGGLHGATTSPQNEAGCLGEKSILFIPSGVGLRISFLYE